MPIDKPLWVFYYESMANAKRDANRAPMLLGTLNSDGTSVQAIYVNSSNHKLKISDGTTGSGTTTTNIQRDGNRVTTIWGVSSADGITPVAIWADSSGNLLTKST